MEPELVVIHEHPEWQKPLFEALDRRGVAYAPFDLKQAAFSNVDAARGTAVLQPGQSECLRPRAHAGRAAGPGLHADARASRRAGAEWRRRVRTGAEQERPSHAARFAGHRHAALDHVQRRQGTRAVCRRHSRGRRSSSPIRAAAARAFRWWSLWRTSRRFSRPTRASGCPTTCSCCRSICRTIPTRASCVWSSWAGSCCTRCA